MRRLWLAWVIACVACGNATPERDSEASDSEASDSEASDSEASDEAPALGEDLALEEVVAPEVAPTDERLHASVALGSMVLLAEACNLSGSALQAHDAFDAVRAIAWTPDGGVLLLDAEGILHRYVDLGDEACVLMPDERFGDHGALTLGESEASRPRSLAVDAMGHLFASSPLGGTDRLTGDHQDYHCETTGRVTVSPNGTVGFGLFGTGPARRIEFTDRGCEMSEWPILEAPSILESVSFTNDDTVLVGGQDGREGPHTARLYDLAGQPLGPAFGSDDASAPDHLCYTHAAFPCAAGLCMVDGNCRTLLARTSDGTIAGRADLSALTGLHAPWIVPPVRIDHGMTFFAAAQPEVDADGSRHFVATVFRLHGL